MSEDYKTAFRAAQAQRGLTAKPTKEQLKALKAKKGPTPAVQQKVPAAAAVPQEAVTLQAAGAAGLPADFFDSKVDDRRTNIVSVAASASKHLPAAASQSQQQQQQLSGAKRPAAGSSKGTAVAAVADTAADAAVPKGFFDDKAQDNKARGIKAPHKKDKEAAFAEFAAAMDDQLKQQAAEEDAEAEEASREREEREAHEQKLRVQRAAELKALKSNPSAARGSIEVDIMLAAVPAVAGKRRRVVDVLQEVLQGGSEGTSEEAEDDGLLLDWRAKAV